MSETTNLHIVCICSNCQYWDKIPHAMLENGLNVSIGCCKEPNCSWINRIKKEYDGCDRFKLFECDYTITTNS